MTVVNALSRPLPSQVFLNGKRLDLGLCAAADDVAGYVDMLHYHCTRGAPWLQMETPRKPLVTRHHGVVRIVFAVKLDSIER